MDLHPLFKLIAARDEAAVVAHLTEHPADATLNSVHGVSLLLTTLYHGLFEAAERIVGIRGSEALDLFEASAIGDAVRVAVILGQSPDAIGSRTPDGFTALHLACFFQQEPCAHLLLSHGAPVDAVASNPSQVAPIHSAVAAGSLKLVRTLVEAGANPNAVQRGGYTPLMGAAAAGLEDIVELLLSNGAQPTPKCDDGQTAADLARHKGHHDLAARLESGG